MSVNVIGSWGGILNTTWRNGLILSHEEFDD